MSIRYFFKRQFVPKRHKVALIAEQNLIFCSQFLRDKRFGMEDNMEIKQEVKKKLKLVGIIAVILTTVFIILIGIANKFNKTVDKENHTNPNEDIEVNDDVLFDIIPVLCVL